MGIHGAIVKGTVYWELVERTEHTGHPYHSIQQSALDWSSTGFALLTALVTKLGRDMAHELIAEESSTRLHHQQREGSQRK